MWSSPFAIPIVAIIGGLTIGAIGMFFGHKEKMRKIEVEKPTGNDREIDALRARVEALEAIVTDDREQLRREIDRL